MDNRNNGLSRDTNIGKCGKGVAGVKKKLRVINRER